VDTWREALAHHTLLGFVGISTLFMLVLAFSLNLDIVNGTLAAGSLFGRAFEFGNSTPAITEVVTTAQSVFAAMLYALGIFLAIFATGSHVPHLMRRGTVDLYLSRPTSRTRVLLGRFLGAVTLVTANIVYLCGGVFLIVSLKTGVWNGRFLLAGGVILVVFLSFLGFMVMVGVLSRSTPLSIMLPYALYVLAMPLAAHDHIAAAMDSRFWARVIHGIYWVLPKTAELGRDVVQLVAGTGAPAPAAVLSTLAFGCACLGIAVFRFEKISF
jgi:ABC-type transport system involved in multi-copper enzyme maturation permease subunit